ncbi:MAG TPA: ATP-dependent Clp protease proteolytic subunit [Deltaproteobacteria bacterium]|jgi:ClpP class serine protease|nr:ATP-dependent Clp protease proteolytic subunit [Deltaproteobacteria bacterium]
MSNLWNLFWIFIIIAALLPVLQQKMMELKRLKVIKDFETKRKSRVITLIHRQEIMKLLGFPLMRYIDITDSEDILRAIRFTPADMPIDMIVHTPGGLVLSSEQIAKALKRHKAKVTIFVPHYAMSGGTLLCLAADEVVMDENAVLGPVDPQLGEYPAAAILNVLGKKEPKDIDDKTFILADVSRKALAQVKDFVRMILSGERSEEDAERIAKIFTEGRWTHDYPIFFEEAKSIGINVSSGMPKEVYQLMDLFPQALQQRPSVQYIPIPYKSGGRQSKP